MNTYSLDDNISDLRLNTPLGSLDDFLSGTEIIKLDASFTSLDLKKAESQEDNSIQTLDFFPSQDVASSELEFPVAGINTDAIENGNPRNLKISTPSTSIGSLDNSSEDNPDLGEQMNQMPDLVTSGFVGGLMVEDSEPVNLLAVNSNSLPMTTTVTNPPIIVNDPVNETVSYQNYQFQREESYLTINLGAITPEQIGYVREIAESGEVLFEDTLENIENVIGSERGDSIIGNLSNNILKGMGGDDILLGVGGNDTLNGGDGIDTVDYIVYEFGLDINLESGTASPRESSDFIDTLISIENVRGSDYDDNIVGNSDSKRLLGLGGDDHLSIFGSFDPESEFYGGDGNDTLDAELCSGTFYGGEGDDKISTFRTWGELRGGNGNDTLHAEGGETKLYGGDGNDTLSVSPYDPFEPNNELYGEAGNDTLFGGPDEDLLDGGPGNDVLDGGSGNDTLDGGSGNDTLDGGPGNDTLDGGPGNNTLDGGPGNDTLYIHDSEYEGENSLYGGDGNDIIKMIGENGGFSLWIEGGNGDDYIKGKAHTIDINGGDGNDIIEATILGSSFEPIYGGNGNDRITVYYAGHGYPIGVYGENGDDVISNFEEGGVTLYGGDGIDRLIDADGSSILVGGLDRDLMLGGSGADRFGYESLNESLVNAPDRIRDFNQPEGDRFQMPFIPNSLFDAGNYNNFNDLESAVRAAYENENLQAFDAIFFKFGSREYLTVNDNVDDFNPLSDLVAEVSGISHASGTVITVDNYFV
ncbi:MAG TPA: hypothetical protein DCF68_03035 [Cyanothece sp. UBA12306]|nr:hypothetical protein [Cyanothece sp. UBA12306]